MRSSVEIYNIRTRQSRIVWQTSALFEAPNWAPDGRFLMLNSDGLIYRLPVAGDTPPIIVDTEFAVACNNDHGISPGTMQIWRVPALGGSAERITDSPYGDWFPHPSPKGDKIVFVSYDGDVFDHPRDLDVRVRLMDMDGSNVETLFELFGGQGTMNSPNWSPDGDEFAYVRYFPVS
ncbi:MAG: hypothetical protein EOP17_17210 [Rhizobiaceae bacterium]|nr:MAG: hypothetical protein EOP17_17210 [Rhizobiaceae bacterium]